MMSMEAAPRHRGEPGAWLPLSAAALLAASSVAQLTAKGSRRRHNSEFQCDTNHKDSAPTLGFVGQRRGSRVRGSLNRGGSPSWVKAFPVWLKFTSWGWAGKLNARRLVPFSLPMSLTAGVAPGKYDPSLCPGVEEGRRGLSLKPLRVIGKSK